MLDIFYRVSIDDDLGAPQLTSNPRHYRLSLIPKT